MPEIIGFDDFDKALEYLQERVQRAKSMATPEQLEITYGDYFMHEWEGIQIFGHIYTQEEFDEAELKAGASKEELAYEHRIYANSYNNGFRFGRCYSVIEPDGELGDTHVSVMTKITQEQFEEAKANNWQLDDPLEMLGL